jgi:hypothetical protein
MGKNRRSIRCDTSRIFPRDENRRATQDPLSQQDAVLLALPWLGQELLLPSQSCTLTESKRGGYAASHRDAMTLAVPAKFTLQLLLWEQPLGARKP